MSNCSCCCCERIVNVITPDCRCGCHIPWQGSLYETLVTFPCKSVQMFWGSPISYKITDITTKDKESSLKLCLDYDRTFYVHAPYICNLANPVNENHRAISALEKLLRQVIGLPGAIVAHIGFGKDIIPVAETINQLEILGVLKHSPFPRVPFHFLLECASGKNNQLGHTWEDLRKLYEVLDKSKVGLCIDTQHAFSAGISNFENHESIVQVWENTEYINSHGISMLHLNDSCVPFGNGNDRHAPLGKGYIWGKEQDGLRALTSLARDMGLDMISETNDVLSDMKLVESFYS